MIKYYLCDENKKVKTISNIEPINSIFRNEYIKSDKTFEEKEGFIEELYFDDNNELQCKYIENENSKDKNEDIKSLKKEIEAMQKVLDYLITKEGEYSSNSKKE